MLRTLVHQNYVRNVAVDDSGFSNHGIPINVTSQFPGFLFNHSGSRITIRPSSSLTNLRAIRLGVRFALVPQGQPHRYNLAEGFESFALFVNSNLSISGTILDPNGQWRGVTSAAGAVVLNQTHSAVFECDGVSALQLSLDGKVVAENYNITGSVRDIGNLGLAIGHWPDPPDIYTFEGKIFEVLLQKNDPKSDLLGLLDPCCVDREALFAWIRSLEQRGITAAQLAAAGEALRTASNESAITLRDGTKAATLRQRELAKNVALALRRRDIDALERILQEWQAFTQATLNSQVRQHLADQTNQALSQFGLRASDWSRLLDLLCLNTCRNERGK